nr:ATP-binding protein [Desulfotomaculum nigrificans]
MTKVFHNGKTHLAAALGLAACQQGRRVKFYQAARWVEELVTAREEHRLLKLEKEWMRDKLVISGAGQLLLYHK